MSKAFLLSPRIPLIDEVIRHLDPKGADYSGSMVVFPGKRPAHFLRKAIAGNGRSYIPPRIFSLDRFVRFLTESDPDHPAGMIDRVDAAAILYDLHEAIPDRIGGDQFRSLDAFLPLGIRLFEELEELVLSCRPGEEIAQSVKGVSLRGLHSLGDLYTQFYDRILAIGRTTRALDYRSTAMGFRKETIAGFPTIILGGLFPISEAERRLIGHLMGMEGTVALFQEGPGMKAALEALGIEVEEKKGVAASPAISYHAAPDSHGEIFGLAGLLDDSIRNKDVIDHRTVIVVPDPSVLPALVHHSLSFLPEGYNISVGYPHARTPMVGFLTSLTDLISASYDQRIPASEYLRCLLHPYSKNLLFEGKPHVTRVLLHTIEDFCLQSKLPPFFSLEDLESESALFIRGSEVAGEEKVTPEKLAEHLKMIHRRLLVPLMHVSSAGECASHFIDILSFIAEQSTARRHLFFGLHLESIISSLTEIRESLLADRTFDHPAPAFRIVRDCLHSGKVPLPGTPLRGLQVLGLLETRNLQFDRVFVLNTNDELIPGETGRYSLVPDLVRRTLGLPTYRERDRVAEYYFSVLLGGAREVSLFFTEDGSKTPSRFVEQLLWKGERDRGSLDRDEQVTDVSYQITLDHAKPGPIGKLPGSGKILREMTFSASSMDTYLTCGLRFYYRYLLRLEEREELMGDIDRAGLGQFVHSVLAEFYKPFIGKELGPEIVDPDRMNDLIEDAFRETFGTQELGNQFLMKLQVKDHLSRFLQQYEAPRIRSGKISLVTVEADLRAEKRGYRFRGRIDRVEQQDGRTVIQDYKTSGDKRRLMVRPEKIVPDQRQTWAEGIGSFQLLLYLLLYADSSGSDPSGVLPQYLLLGRNDLDSGIELPLFDEQYPFGRLFPVLEEVMFAMLDELTDEGTPFFPTDDLEANCPHCAFTQLCGTSWVKRRGRL